MTPQLPLDLGHVTALSAADFLIAPCNAEAQGQLDRWPDWPGPMLCIHGPRGCGKTHMLAAFAERHANARPLMMGVDRLVAGDPHRLMGDRRLLLLDDLDRLSGRPAEEALFHLWNMARQGGFHIAAASLLPPSRLSIGLADLRSRLNAALAVEIGPPDDALLAAVLVKHFADRQLRIAEGVVAYVLGRIERSFAAVAAVAAALDHASLAERRAITVPLARTVLEGRAVIEGRE